MLLLENKVAFVSGGGSGIGQAVAETYAREGAKVVVSDTDEAGGQAVVDQIKKDGGEAIFIKADSSIPADNKRIVQEIVAVFGRGCGL